jgi:hypothetical protein
MKSFKKLLLAKSIIAAAVASSGIAAPAVSHAATATSGTAGPSVGMECRAGYTPNFNGTRLTCSKASSFDVPLECNNPNFPVYVVRRGGPSGVGFDGDSDICIRNNGTVITINQTLEGLPPSTNGSNGVYELAKVNPLTIANKTIQQQQAEAAALGLIDPRRVEALAGTPVLRPNGRAGGQGEARVPVTFFNFAIEAQTGGVIIGNQVPNGVPGTVTSAAPFVPKALPR